MSKTFTGDQQNSDSGSHTHSVDDNLFGSESKQTIEILLVEGNEDHVELISDSLSSMKRPVKLTVATDLHSARKQIAESVPQLIISDQELPDGAGTDLIPTESPDYPVVILTSHGDGSHAVSAMKAGAIDYVVKSEITLLDMAHIVEKTMREWSHIQVRRQAEAALASREQLYRHVIASANAVAYQFDFELYEYVHLDANIINLTGFNAAEFTHSIWRSVTQDCVLSGEAKGMDVQEARDAFLQGRLNLFICEYRILSKEGEVRYLSCTAIPIRNADGSVTGSRGILQDITERKQAERSLQKREYELRFITDSVGALISYIDHYLVYRFVNKKYEELFNRSRDEILGRSVREVLGKAAFSKIEKKIQQAISGERVTFEELIPLKNIGERWLSITYMPDLNSEGQVIGLFVVINDFSERKQAEEELMQRREELAHMMRLNSMGELATGLAHELNQPLAAIATYADSCRRVLDAESNLGPSSKSLQILKKLEDQSLRAGEIIHRLRKFVSKEKTDRLKLNLNDTVLQAVDFLSHEISKFHIVLSFDFEEGLPKILGDPIQIEQVILNLIQNSIRAMKNQDNQFCEIVVTTRSVESNKVQVLVRDNGCGIPPERLDIVFEPFMSTNKEGMGMGLPISLSIVESHQGSLVVAPNDDQGVTFTMTLPRETLVEESE